MIAAPPSKQISLWKLFGLFSALLIISVLLSAPAALYAWMRPTVPNLLSLVLSIGFFVSVGVLIRNRTALVVLGLCVLLLNTIEIVHLFMFGGLIALGAVETILSADPHEAREFAADRAGQFAAALLIVPPFIALVRFKAFCDQLTRRGRMGVAVGATFVPALALTGLLATAGSSDEVYLPTRVVEHYVAFVQGNPLTQTVSGLVDALAARRDLVSQRAARSAAPLQVEVTTPPKSEVWVVVIGESSRRRNWGIYGYERDTTPLLRNRAGLHVFTNAISPANLTDRSVPRSFYFPTSARDGTMQVSSSAIGAFRAGGFKTFWLSNQGQHRSAVGGEISWLMSEAEVVRTTNYGFWNSTLDGVLIEEFDNALADPAARKLIVVHTLGSHTMYRQRYPAAWASRTFVPPAHAVPRSAPINATDEITIDDYDKTILYTDWLLDQLIGKLHASGRLGGLVYFSDHGQRLYDDRNHHRGHGFYELKGFDVEIPLLVWLSEPLAKAQPDLAERVFAAARKPATTSDIGSSLLDLAGIRLKSIAETPSIFHPLYDPVPRRVLMPDGKLLDYETAPERWMKP